MDLLLPLPLPRILVLAVLSATVGWLVYQRIYRRSAYPLPPGPPGRFLVGNLGQLSVEDPAQDYLRWGKEYSACLPSYNWWEI